MPALQNLVLTDRATTPVNHTFVPDGVDKNVGRVVETTGVKAGDSSFTVSSRKTANGNYRATLKLAIPKVEAGTVNGITVNQVTRTAIASVEFSFSKDSTLQERKDIVGMLQSSLDASKVLVNNTIVNLESVYG
jgi:hypothetical protein